ncbi:MAG: hypothetical protein Q9157_004695 [Trypethelium eluteriae]
MFVPILSTIVSAVFDVYDVEHGLGRHASRLSPEDYELITRECTPFRASYAEVPGSHCKSETLLLASQQLNGILACVIDITTALIPAFLLWDLQMKRQTKIILDTVFFLGLFTAGLSVSRAATTNKTTFGPDLPFKQCISGILSCIEVNMGMFFASCPVLRQLIAYVMRHRTILPTRGQNPPNGDFIAMRKRITLRDIFWYRKRTSNEISPPPSAPPTKPREISSAAKPVKISAMDRIWGTFGRAFGVTTQGDAITPRHDRLSHSEKGLIGSRSEEENTKKSKESQQTFLLSGTNTSGNGWSLDPTNSGASDSSMQ